VDCPDDDSDGLADSWELDGIDANCDGVVDVPLLGAFPKGHPDIFIEADYMVEPGPLGHSHMPNPAAVKKVVDAFALHGITVHFEVGSDVGHWTALMFQPPDDAVHANYFTIMANHFDPARRNSYRYAVYGHFINTTDGNATPGGYGYVGLPYIAMTTPNVNWPACPDPAFAEGNNLMHELGHTLNLDHGGGDGINFKPNYISIMNYSYGTGWQPLKGLYFSTQILDPLKECCLDECAGLEPDVAYEITYRCNGAWMWSSGTGKIDWDCNGADGDPSTPCTCPQVYPGPPPVCGGIAHDIGGDPGTPHQDLVGYNDWDIMQWGFQCMIGDPSASPAQELTMAQLRQQHVLYSLLRVDIEFKNDGGTINLESNGRTTVSVLGSNELDATQVDPSSIRFAGAQPIRIDIEDSNEDGRDDFLATFVESDLHLVQASTTGLLTGWLVSSQAIAGKIPVRIVPPAK